MTQSAVALNLKDHLARWIWTSDPRNLRHYFMFARRTFNLRRPPTRALLFISACDHYRLYVNGRYLGRGPQRGDPKWQSYDTYDVTALLAPGRNAVAVQTYRYGIANILTRDTLGGLFARLEIESAGGGSRVIGTDGAWKVRAARGWDRTAKEVVCVGVTEVLDSRLDPADWIEAAGDDRAWENATVIPRNREPCPVLLPRDIPMLVEKEIHAEKVHGVSESLVLSSTTVDIPELLAREIHQPLRYCKVGNPRGLLRPTGAPTVVTLPSLGRDANVFDGHFNPHIVLDFGRMVNAFPRVEVEAPAGTIIDLTCGQELIGGRIAPVSGVGRFGDRCLLRGGRQVWEMFEYRNFRYLQITVRNASQPVRIHCVSANTYRYPMTQKGRFACSDPVLTKTWQACVNTADLCADDGYIDTSAREKRNWLGDGSHGVPAIYAGFGEVALTARYFRMTCWGGLGDGMLRMFYPGSDYRPEGSEMPSLIPHHSLVWATRLWENWEFFGRREILENAFPALEGLAQWFRRNRDADGLLSHLPYWNWLDWTPADLRGENLGTNAFYLKMLQDLARIAEVLGQPAQALPYRAEAERVRQVLHTRFWDAGRGLFLDSYLKGRLTGVASELGNALAVLYGIADARQGARVMAHLAHPRGWIAPVTPLFAYYVMQAYGHVGDRKGLVDFIQRRYGPMVARSATIWEGWERYAGRGNLEPAHTDAPELFPDGIVTAPWSDYRAGAQALAHCGGTPAAFVISTDILGVRPVGAGFERCRIEPAIDVVKQAEGVFPSVKGKIGVAWKRSARSLRIEISLPRGLGGEVILPASSVADKRIRVNGRTHPGVEPGGKATIPVNQPKTEIVVTA
jgi:hypothetical protein